MSYTFNGREITNTKTNTDYDCTNLLDLEDLTQHLNNLETIINTYKEAIQINKGYYKQAKQEPMLLPKTREAYKHKYEAILELEEKIELITKAKGGYPYD